MPEVAQQHQLQILVDALYEKHRGTTDGELATYIPELAKVNPQDFGICVVTAGGDVFEAGDCDRPFTIQSISKAFTYGLAMDEFGADKVLCHVGVEPSGDAFNAIELHSGTNRPYNPMINSGAITITALLHSRYGDQTFERVLECFSTIAGRELSIDKNVYESERRTGQGQARRLTTARSASRHKVARIDAIRCAFASARRVGTADRP